MRIISIFQGLKISQNLFFKILNLSFKYPFDFARI